MVPGTQEADDQLTKFQIGKFSRTRAGIKTSAHTLYSIDGAYLFTGQRMYQDTGVAHQQNSRFTHSVLFLPESASIHAKIRKDLGEAL